jgi:hypothetical protein
MPGYNVAVRRTGSAQWWKDAVVYCLDVRASSTPTETVSQI